MRITLVVAALIATGALTSAACSPNTPRAPGDVPGVPGAAKPWPWPAELNLPVSGVAGDVPPLGETVVITCTAAGVVRVGAVLVERPADLVARLAERVDRDDAGASSTNVLLAFDASVPWRVVAWALLACANPRVSAPRIFFAVRHAGDREPGAFAAFLPEDRCVHDPGLGEAHERTLHVTVPVTTGSDTHDPGTLGPWLVARRAPAGEPVRVMISLDPDADAPLDAVIAAADAAARGGAAALLFESVRAPAGDVVSWFVPAEAAGSGPRFGVRLPPGEPSPVPGALPTPPRGGGFAGFAESVATWDIEEKPEEEPPPSIEDAPR